MPDALLILYMFFIFIHFFFFNDTATTEIYTLSLHDALPIWWRGSSLARGMSACGPSASVTLRSLPTATSVPSIDRKSTRLNSSHIPLSRMPSSA